MEGYSIRCDAHIYITLEYEGKFLICLDNDCMKAEEMICYIQRRTGMKFQDITIKGNKEDFNGLSFFKGGWKRDFWNEFPDDKELNAYMKLKNGRM